MDSESGKNLCVPQNKKLSTKSIVVVVLGLIAVFAFLVAITVHFIGKYTWEQNKMYFVFGSASIEILEGFLIWSIFDYTQLPFKKRSIDQGRIIH